MTADPLLVQFLRLCARHCKLFSLDTRLRLFTDYPMKTAQYFVYNRMAAIAQRYVVCEDPEFVQYIEKATLEDEAAQAALNWQLPKMVKQLAAKNIPVVIVKGPTLQSLYPAPGLRPFNDVDLYLEPDMVNAAVECFSQAGYLIEGDPWRTEFLRTRTELKMMLPGSTVAFDIHWDLADSLSIRKGLSFDLNSFQSEMVPYPVADTTILQFAPELLFVYMVSHHLLHHVFRGLIWLLDMVLFLNSHSHIDWPKVQQLTQHIQLHRAIHYYGIALEKLGLWTIPPNVMAALRPKSIRYRLLSKAYAPATIFHPYGIRVRFKRQILREAFKFHPSSKYLHWQYTKKVKI